MLDLPVNYPFLTTLVILFYASGIFCAGNAILFARTPQGATAWVMSLLGFPFVAVPLYLIFGRSKFYGYTTKRRIFDEKVNRQFHQLENISTCLDNPSDELKQFMSTLNPLIGHQPGFTCGNSISLLVNGEETYRSILEALESAKSYIIFQFYIIRMDDSGKKFTEVLMRKAREGVRVTMLYDEIGTEIPKAYLAELKSTGMNVCHFNSMSGKGRMQVNFRNHRKVVVVDGDVAFLGGFNIGDDYLGLWPEIGPWRDTHLRISGPSVIAAQMATAKDWFWCKEEHIQADWKLKPTESSSSVLILPSGPADDKHKCLLTHISMVNAATERLWIANPYFVPPESLVNAIHLAALRGVDVRLLVPSYSDNKSIMLASQVYQERALKHGVRIFKYSPGFLHQKVILVDNLLASVGSVNLDFRSMFINFEITAICSDKKFINEVAEMLENDLNQSEEIFLEHFENVPLLKRLTYRGANLFSPVL